MSLLNDDPVAGAAADRMGVSGAAGRLARLLLDSRDATPFTLAVEAGWGMGKSSLMRLVDEELRRAPDVHTLWYNAWTSSGADSLEGLIKSVLMTFDPRVLRRALRRVPESGVLVKAARALSLVVAGQFGMAGLADQLWQTLSADPRSRNDMRERLRGVAQDWAEHDRGSGGRRLLVVFVDDLDRCSEETVLAVCEAVKIYLDIPGIAFVIGCDRSALAPSGLLRDLSPAGSAFMEKIFQTSYRVPLPERHEIEAFVRRCARESGVTVLLDDDLVSLIVERCGRNPRRIKKLINGFVLETGLNPLWRGDGASGGDPRDTETVTRTLLLQHLYPDFYRMLVASAASYGDVLTEFRTYCRVRRVLRGVPGEQDAETDLARFFAEHEVRPPGPDREAWDEALAELERQLPSGFPELAADRAFTSLIEDLLRLPGGAALIERLRSQPRPAAAEFAVQRGPEPAAVTLPRGRGRAGTWQAGEQPLAGMRVLWIDDDPASVDFDAAALRRAGALVAVVPSGAEAEQYLATAGCDLVISDIARGSDREAGFTDLRRFREEGTHTGPVIFYTGRVTPAREKRAEELGALGVVADPSELHWRVAQVAGARGTRPHRPRPGGAGAP